MKRLTILILLSFYVSTYLGGNECDSKLFSLSAYKKKGSSLKVKNILQELSLKCNLSIVFKDERSKKAIEKELDFVNIKDYTFDDFLDFLFTEANLFYTYDKTKNKIVLQYLKNKTFSIDYVNISELESESTKSISTGSSVGSDTGSGGTGVSASIGGGTPSSDYTLMTSKSKFAFWENLEKNIKKLFDNPKDVSMFLNQDASLLSITANKKELKKVENFLNTLMEKMHKQVLIEAKIIEVIYSKNKANGIDWSQLNISLSGSFSGNAETNSPLNKSYNFGLAYSFSTDKFIQFLNRYGTVRVLSSPKILTLNNQPAVINVGEQLSYKYQTGSVTTTGGTAAGTNTFSLGSTFVGITLYVIPEVSKSNEIIMKINPVVSKLADETSSPETTRELPPDIKIKQLTSIVKVKDGQKVLIGGLIGVTKNKETRKIPILSDIPVLNGLFGSEQILHRKSEMFILITPKIIKTDNMPTIDDLDLSACLFDNKRKLQLQ